MSESAEEYIPSCMVCGIPYSCCRLIRITFVDDGHGKVTDLDGAALQMFRVASAVVAKVPKSNDSLVCEDCIRSIKRMPFSDIANGLPP